MDAMAMQTMSDECQHADLWPGMHVAATEWARLMPGAVVQFDDGFWNPSPDGGRVGDSYYTVIERPKTAQPWHEAEVWLDVPAGLGSIYRAGCGAVFSSWEKTKGAYAGSGGPVRSLEVVVDAVPVEQQGALL